MGGEFFFQNIPNHKIKNEQINCCISQLFAYIIYIFCVISLLNMKRFVCSSSVFLFHHQPFSSFHPAPAGRREPAQPNDGELHAVHLENTPVGAQTEREQQAPCSCTTIRSSPASDAPVCSCCVRRRQPLHRKEALGEHGGGKVWPRESERGKEQRLLQDRALPPPSPPDQEL